MLAINLLITLAVSVLNYFYQLYRFSFVLKCICSSGFALLGIINLCYAIAKKKDNTKFYIGMSSGLVLAMLGDILIGCNFIIGAATFALGHVCFVVAYCFVQRMKALDYIISGVLFLGGGAFLMFSPLLSFDVPIFKGVCVVYALIISFMLGKAIGNFLRKKSVFTGTVAIASALFFFSDLMLVLDWFAGLWDWTDHACMGTYYPALCLLAVSMYIRAVKEKNEE